MSHILSKHCQFVDEAFVYGQMFDLGDYPGIVMDHNRSAQVYGDCFKLLDPTAALATFDDYEECGPAHPTPWLYLRETQTCYLKAGNSLKAWVYVYNRDLTDKPLIEGGDYLKYRPSKKGAV